MVLTFYRSRYKPRHENLIKKSRHRIRCRLILTGLTYTGTSAGTVFFLSGVDFLAAYQLGEVALLGGACHLVTALEQFINKHGAALGTLIGVIRSTGDDGRIPVSAGALIERVVAAAVKHLAVARFFLDDSSAATFTRTVNTRKFEYWSLLGALFRRAGQIISIASITDKHGRRAGLAFFFGGSVFRHRQSVFGQGNLGFAFGVADASKELAEAR